MVSTRQMTMGSSGTADCSHHPLLGDGPAKYTRNSTAALAAVHGPGTSSKYQSITATKSIQFLDLPQEILEKIFSYLKYKNICQMRFVCTRIDAICSNILNTTFQRLQNNLLVRFQTIKSKMPRRESARRNHHLACESDIIETLHMRLTLLQMSLGKHIERKHCCFFPGEILDEVNHILHYIKITPKLARPYKVTDELFDLSTMAMEYFKEKIEPDLPEIAYFSTDFLDYSTAFPTSSTSKYLSLDPFPIDMEEAKDSDQQPLDAISVEDPVEPLPQSNMVLRKRIKKIKQGMKRYNSQLTMLRQDLRVCKRKTTEQQKQITEQQKQLAEQQKQTVEYSTRLDENDKKNEEISRKFSTLLQELNKCKTELQYWRSKSPATPSFCTGCGNVVGPHPDELQALMNQGVNPDGLGLEPFIPIAELSGGGDDGGIVDENVAITTELTNLDETSMELVIEPSTCVAPTPIRVVKRKLDDIQQHDNKQSVATTTSKKARRIAKIRSKRFNNV